MSVDLKSAFNQTRKGDPRLFITSKTTQDALWASKDAYLKNNKSSREGLTQLSSHIVEPGDIVSSSLNKLFGQNGIQICVYRDTSNPLNNNLIVAFEGTNSFSSIWKDVQLFQSEKPDIEFAKGKVHSGFNSIYRQAKPILKEIFNKYPQANVTFTGHSLGGALASLALADNWKVSTSKAITFGAPQVGDDEFSKWFLKSNKQLDRVVQKSDPITIGNMNYKHMDNSAWVIGNNGWMDINTHGIDAYDNSMKRVNNQVENMNNDKYVYPMAHKFLNAIDTSKKIVNVLEYLEGAEEVYQIVSVASDLPQTMETLKNVLFTQDGVLNRSFEVTIDSLSKFKTPSKEEFKRIFTKRISELQQIEQTSLINSVQQDKVFIPENRNIDKLITIETNTGKFTVDEVAARLENKGTITVTESEYISPPKSNYNSIIKSKIQSAVPKYPILETAITNIKKTKDWVSKITSPVFKGVSTVSGIYGASEAIHDIASGNVTWEDAPETALKIAHGALTAHEAATSLGFIKGITSGSFIAGVTAPALATTASAIGLMSFALYSVLERKKKGLYNDLGGNGVLNRMRGVRDTSSERAKNTKMLWNYLSEIQNFANKTNLSIPLDFLEQSFYKIEFRDGTIKMKDDSPIEDLLYPPIQGVHANEPEKYEKFALAKNVFDYSKDMLNDIDEENFISQYAEKMSRNGESINIDGQPFQDVLSPEIMVDGKKVLPSKQPELYNAASQLERSFQGIMSKDKLQEFIDKNASNTIIENGKILINGEDVRDIVFPPIGNIKLSDNLEAYKKGMLTDFLYKNLSENKLIDQPFEDFLDMYYPSINTDPDGNIIIRDTAAASFPFKPIIDPNGVEIYKIKEPMLYDKVSSFHQHSDVLVSKLKGLGGKTLTKDQIWNEYKDSIQTDQYGNLIFGMTSQESKSAEGQTRIMDYIEKFAESQNIELDNNFYKVRTRLERSGVPLSISTDNGQITLNNQNWLGYFFRDMDINGYKINFLKDPIDYMSALSLKNDPEVLTYTPAELKNKLSDLSKNSTIPSLNLSSIAGQWTSSIGVLQGQYKDTEIEKRHAPEDFRLSKRRIIQNDNPFSSLEDSLKRGDISSDNKEFAVELLYKQFVNNGEISIDFDEFRKTYIPYISFDSQGNILVNNSRQVPPPIPLVNRDGEKVFRVENADEWDKLNLANNVFNQLSESGKISEDERTTFLTEYTDRLDLKDGQIYLDNNEINSMDTTEPTMLNPVEGVDTKLSMVKTDELLNEIETSSSVQTIPGSNGFVPTGDILEAFLVQDQWIIMFENRERDAHVKKRNPSGFSLMGNWIGPSPYSNAPPINTLDSFFLAYHVQAKHSNTMATNFLIARVNEALKKGTISPLKDVREFEIATMIMDLPETSEIFEIMKIDDTACNTLNAAIQRNWKDMTNRSIMKASLPRNVDPHKLALVPKLQHGDNVIKRTIEAAGIIDDVSVQSKVRKIYSDYLGIVEFSHGYMDLVSQAQGDTIVPNMDRTELEGRIAEDDVKKTISREIVKVLSMPLIEFFK